MQALINDPKSAEGREWLASSHHDHAGFKMSRAIMLQWVNKFYDAGAKKVSAVNITQVGLNQVCAELVVEMPVTASQRQAVLKVYDELNEDEDPSIDKNERYLDVDLD